MMLIFHLPVGLTDIWMIAIASLRGTNRLFVDHRDELLHSTGCIREAIAFYFRRPRDGSRRERNSRHSVIVTASISNGCRASLEAAGQPMQSQSGIGAQKTAFMFSGQGSQRPQMGRQLLEANETFRKHLLDLDQMVADYVGSSLVATFQADVPDLPARFLTDLQVTHPAIFIIECAVARTMMDYDVVPDIVVATSMGIFAALAIAGHMDVETALQAVIRQARTIEEHCPTGAMIALIDTSDDVVDAITRRIDCEVAAKNFRSNSVLGVRSDNRAALLQYLSDRDLLFEELPVRYAFHTRWIDDAASPYGQFLEHLAIRPSTVKVAQGNASPASCTLRPGDLWTAVRQTVHFEQCILNLGDSGIGRFIDVGPSGNLAAYTRRILQSSGCSPVVVPVLTPFGERLPAFCRG